MTVVELVSTAIVSCGLSLPPMVTPERVATYAQVESQGNPNAVSPPNRNGTRDYGLMQINEIHFTRFRVNSRTVMDICNNLRIGITIIAENDRRSACAYNTGRMLCQNGYDDKIATAASHRTVSVARPPAPPEARRTEAPIRAVRSTPSSRLKRNR